MIKQLKNERGSQAIEFVAVLPLFSLMIIIVWQFALASTAKVTAEAAAMDGARMAIVSDDRGDVEKAVSKVAHQYEHTVSLSDEGDDYVTVQVTIQVPLLDQDALFDTTGLSLPVSAEVSLRKEQPH
ncbi:pilus assembly protein [Brevibacillus humidisoli]|uniref:TadE/TadG family type IV pilus assembly protein n=1 Tax=Brevibacillus humidisoli TaxID=2895522 RepID=UPI001E428A33|nr:TadE family protein [Brevibacillus humidisoli]UFJ40800.1 pilus assembly protein [Brevibacillus humidisoli]